MSLLTGLTASDCLILGDLIDSINHFSYRVRLNETDQDRQLYEDHHDTKEILVNGVSRILDTFLIRFLHRLYTEHLFYFCVMLIDEATFLVKDIL